VRTALALQRTVALSSSAPGFSCASIIAVPAVPALSAVASAVASAGRRGLHCSSLFLREQFNKDKERMKMKKEKAAEAKKKGGVMKDKAANVEAGADVGVSVPAMEEKMEEYVEAMRAALAQIKAGRAVPAQLDEVIVSAHGKLVPLKAIATVSARNATTLVVQIYDPTLLKEVDKSIRLHSPTLNPVAETEAGGNAGALSVAFPKVTREVREGLVKQVSKKAEETRGHLRTLRQQYLQQLKVAAASEDNVSKDLVSDLKNQIQASHDVIAAKVKKLQDEKDKEINQV